MANLMSMIRVELRKALRSRMPFFTLLASLFMPLGVTFLIFMAKNPALSHKLGLISAKADLTAYFATDWSSYLALFAQIVSMGGFIFFVMVVSWVFGREFVDGTLKDILAVPIARETVLLAKFIVVTAWSVAITMIILVLGLIMGAMMHLPLFSSAVLSHGLVLTAVSSGLTILVVLPFAFLASAGRGYLLPMGAAVLVLILGNILVIAGWGELYPWSIPELYAQGSSVLPSISYWVVVFTAGLGVLGTALWWRYADHHG